MGGLVIEAHVHGLPIPNVKFYKDNHLLHARRNKVVFFVENKEIFQCLLVRPDASATGTYTILADNAAGKRRFDHHVDFETKYPLIHLPGMYHADKKLDDFVDDMISKIPKAPEEAQQQPEVPVEQPIVPTEQPAIPAEQPTVETAPIEKKEEEIAKVEVQQPPKPEEIVEALQTVASEIAEGEKPAEAEKPKHKSKSKSKHRKKKRAHSPKIDSDLINDGEDEATDAEELPEGPYKRKFSTVVHESYETEEFRIYNNKQKLWFSGGLRDQTAIEGSTIKLICAVSGPLPIIKWTKNERPINWGQTIRNMSGEGIGQIIIEKISRQDAGTYTCSAKNPVNEVTTSATIKVIPKSTVPKDDSSKPLFTRILGQFYHITEDDLILDAHVRGVPKPEIKWYKDGVELTKAMDDRFDICNDHDGGYQFRIHKPVSSDSGLYACEAINSTGKAKVSHKLEFNDRERHTHPQFVYHKESFHQPSLRMSIEPEPVKQPEEGFVMPEFDEAAGQSGNDSINIQGSQDAGSGSGGQESSEAGDGNSGTQNGSSGGDGNEDGDEGKDIPKSTSDVPEETEEDEEKEKPKKAAPRTRRKRYEGPVEPLLIRDSVSPD